MNLFSSLLTVLLGLLTGCLSGSRLPQPRSCLTQGQSAPVTDQHWVYKPNPLSQYRGDSKEPFPLWGGIQSWLRHVLSLCHISTSSSTHNCCFPSHKYQFVSMFATPISVLELLPRTQHGAYIINI